MNFEFIFVYQLWSINIRISLILTLTFAWFNEENYPKSHKNSMQGDLFCEYFQSTKRNNISTALVSIPRFPRFSAHNFVIRRLRKYKYVSTNVGTMYILQKIHFLFSYHQFEWYQEWHNTFIFREHIFMLFDQIKTIQIVSFGHL